MIKYIMVKKISIKTKLGWISAFEKEGKIFRIKFGKTGKQTKSKTLIKFKNNLLNFLGKKSKNITAPYKMEGSNIQKKIWGELKKLK